MRKYILFVVFALWGLVTVEAHIRRALLIGLGQQADTGWAKIHGDRDVFLMRSFLQQAGFKDIRTLVNGQATKKAIVTAFSNLTLCCRPGDVVYVHFSGHGQQMTDREGDERDHWDECWIPYDARLRYGKEDDGRFHLTDDEVNRLLWLVRRKIGPTGKILVVVDACHSGDSTRGENGEICRGTSDRFVLPVAEPVAFVQRNSEDWITLSACRDYQRNAEIKTEKGFYGKLTLALCHVLKGGGMLTDEQFYKRICSFFDRHQGSLPQTPVISGTTSNCKIADILNFKE